MAEELNIDDVWMEGVFVGEAVISRFEDEIEEGEVLYRKWMKTEY